MRVVPAQRYVWIALAGILSAGAVWRYVPDASDLFSKQAVKEVQVVADSVGEAVADSTNKRIDELALILGEMAMDTTKVPPITVTNSSDVVHWDGRLDKQDREIERIRRIVVMMAERQLRELCWSSRNRDRDCQKEMSLLVP